MKHTATLLLIILLFCTPSCAKKNKLEPTIRFETTYGKITVKLYAKTSQHRDNFVKLVNDGYYDGVLFHRVIKDFMIQAGDPDSKTATPSAVLGSGDVSYTITAEIVYPQYFHKKGALAAARQGDDINPQRASSGGQFYFVMGRKYTDEQLDALEEKNKEKLKEKLMHKFSQNNQNISNELLDSIQQKIDKELSNKALYQFTAEQREVYKTIGGTPHLDGEYTVFGEVIEGFEIVRNISKTRTGKIDRPTTDIRIIKAKVIR